MATKSDFAQKLLQDLRLRKERMAASQSSSHSNLMATDTYGNPGQTYRGSHKIKALESVGSKIVNSQRRSSGGSRSFNIEESNKQIVPYGRGQGSEQIGDLSMALFFALGNGGKLNKMESSSSNSVLSFLHQIGRRSLDIGKMERSSRFDKHHPSASQFPTLSHLHIKDISKGVQNLNQILRAFSNGLNFDRYSVEVGKELLKGAMDLEESLRMLVNLQEASEYMNSSQRNNRITLLDEDEDDEANTPKMVEQKQLGLPRFSFDKPSRTSHGMNDVKQRLLALTYQTDATSFLDKQALPTSNLVAHKRSASCGPNFKTLSPFSEPKSQSCSLQSKPEKGRISNVIAKLMGLEGLPEKVDSQTRRKESSSRQKEGMILKTTNAKTKNAEPKTRQTENKATLTSDKKVLIQANNISPNANSGVAVSDVKPQGNNFERENTKNAASGSKKATITMDRQQGNMRLSSQIPGNQKNSQERERAHGLTRHKEQKSTEKDETKEPVLKDELQQKVPQKHRSPEVLNISQEKIEHKESKYRTEKRIADMPDRLNSGNQQKPQEDHVLHRQHILQKSDRLEEKHQAEKTEQQITKQNLHARKNKGSPARNKVPSKPMHGATSLQKKQPHMNQPTSSKKVSTQPIGAMPPKELPENKHYEDLVRDESSTDRNEGSIENLGNENLDQHASAGELGSKLEMAKDSMRPLMQDKPIHVPATGKKVDFMQMHRSKSIRKMDEVMTRRNGTLNNLARPLKHHIPIMQEPKHRRHDKISSSKGTEQSSSNGFKKAEGDNKGSKKSEESIQPLSRAQQVHPEGEQTTNSSSSVGDECQSPKLVRSQTSNDSIQNITSEVWMVSNKHQRQAPVFREDQERKSHKTSPNPLHKAYEGSTEICYLSQHERRKVFTSATQELLTENEKYLKEKLIKSQLFLNAAEALFKLNIPVGILHVGDHCCQDEDTKLTLDCAYEVMNRKGRRQELGVHPCVKISISYTKLRSLDDLVKQLLKDFERLKFYNRNRNDENAAADHLHKMLETEIQNTDPDLNSTWDFGWNEMMFAYDEKDEVIRHVERHVLNGLIDEITKDCYM